MTSTHKAWRLPGTHAIARVIATGDSRQAVEDTALMRGLDLTAGVP
jgi:hypothetical protein